MYLLLFWRFKVYSRDVDTNSWHYNYFGGKSVIEELITLLKDNRYLVIYTDTDSFFVTPEDDVQIGERAMMIGSDDMIRFINTDRITHLELCRSKTLNKNKNKNINNKSSSLNDSKGE